MGGDSNPWCLAAHTLSRRAQSTALSPILLNRNRARAPARARFERLDYDYEHEQEHEELKLQPPEQFVERELQADVELAEFAVVGAHGVEAHFVNDRLNLKRVLGEQRDTPLGIVESGRTSDQLFHFPGVLPANGAMPEHELASFFERQ